MRRIWISMGRWSIKVIGNGGLAAPVFASPRSFGPVSAAHQAEQAGTQMSPRHGVERGVDGLVGEPHGIGHTSQCARNLRWTQALAELVDDDDKERIAGNELARDTRPAGLRMGPAGRRERIDILRP